MRILLDLRHVKFGKINGVARFSLTLLDYYEADISVNSITLLLSDKKLLDDFPQHKCIIVNGNPFLPRSIFVTSFLCWKLKNVIDIVHFCNYTTHFWRLPKSTHVIVTIHDLMFMTCKDFYKSSKFQFLKTFYFKLLVNAAIKNCNLVQTVSDYTKSNVIQNFPKSRVKSFLVSAPLADKSSIAYKVERLPLHEGRYLVYVGSDRSHKKLHWIIDEVNNQKQSDFTLLVIGAREVETELNSKVRFLKNVDDEALQNIDRFAEANVLMSIDEGYGLSVKEAAANMCISIMPPEAHFKQFEDLEVLWVDRGLGLNQMLARLWGMSNEDISSQKQRVLHRYEASSHNDEHIKALYKGLLPRG